MSIRVTFFASLRESLGQGSAVVEPGEQALTALQVWQQATGQDSLPSNVLIAQNHEYIAADSMVADGDEIAFFPPVTGG